MKNCMRNKRNNGFTMVEMLAAVAIIVILLAISAVSVVRYIDLLKITELDNAAREIYMAAENRAVLLSGNQRLTSLVTNDSNGQSVGTFVDLSDSEYHGGSIDSHGIVTFADGDTDDPVPEGEQLYYVHVDDVKEELLLDIGNIDPTLLEGDFYIVYDLTSGSVTDVIYAEEANTLTVSSATEFQGNYKDWWTQSRSDRIAAKSDETKGVLVGFYNGEAAEASAQLTTQEGQPIIYVDIYNREELTVTVTVLFDKDTVPEDAVRAAVIEALKDKKLEVWLGPKGNAKAGIDLMKYAPARGAETSGYLPTGFNVSETSYSWTWVLDSLTKQNCRFSNFNENEIGVKPGDNFTVTAIIPRQSLLNVATRSADGSSLFEKYVIENGSGTAYIAYLRHLQNLDINGGYNSGVGGLTTPITSAVQTADIWGDGNGGAAENGGHKAFFPDGYNFIPISNDNLQSYKVNPKGQNYYEIRDLNVNTGISSNSFGLFRNTRAGGMSFTNIRLVNTVVKAGATNASVGALAGTAANASITNCWVYWESEDELDLQETLGVSGGGASNAYAYQLTGGTVGGLVGTAGGNTEIEKSLAATLINGTNFAGGLIGRLEAGGTNTITNSYADCYLTGDGQVAGLIGDLGADVGLSYCYSAGFVMGISEKANIRAAGLCLGNGTATANHVYTVLRYPGTDGKNTAADNSSKIWDLAQTALGSGSDYYYYLSGSNEPETGTYGGRSYEKMTGREFAATMNGGDGSGTFARKTARTSNPYNLRANLTLGVYSYPGLQDLDHYGDWGAQFKDPSLVYYEHYAEEKNGNTWGISGGNARNLIDTIENGNLQNANTILSDGYAVAFLKSDVLENGAFKFTKAAIKYWYTDYDDNGTLTIKTRSTEVSINALESQETQWDDESGSGTKQTAYLIPLPDELVYSNFALDCFYRYLKIELYYLGDGQSLSDSSTPDATGEYLFNPHFAEAIQIYSAGEDEDDGNPIWDENMEAAAAQKAKTMGAVKIRTPRHLFDLSEFTQYSKYSYRQMLSLDYGTYNWYGVDAVSATRQSIMAMTAAVSNRNTPAALGNDGKLARLPYVQKPIGSDPNYDGGVAFTESYDGGHNLIQNVIPEVDLKENNRYVGLFGYSTGVLRHIVYNMGPDDTGSVSEANYQLTAGASNVSGSLYIGGLAGYNFGTITNCAVYGMDLNVNISGVTLYVGGMVGLNNGTISSCSAESKSLAGNSYEYGKLYMGGFVGQNSDSRLISSSYAVGRIDVVADDTASIRLCGFAGRNSGIISDAYAAVDLESSGLNVEAYGFCANEGQQLGNLGYLDQGSYAYRKINFAANYKREAGDEVATGYTYAQMTDPAAESAFPRPAGMGVAARAPQGDGEQFLYPAAVKDANGDYVHYGKWPGKMAMGQMGVFYWEKLEIGGKETYHISALAVDGEQGAITKVSTLSTAHDDGGVITAYGYGYYYDETLTGAEVPHLQADDIGYFAYINYNTHNMNNVADISSTGGANDEEVPKYSNDGNRNLNSNNLNDKDCLKTDDANAKLEETVPGYKFYAWDSYHEGAMATNIDGPRVKNSTAGLTPKVMWNPESQKYGTFTLQQGRNDDGTYETTVAKFIINPQFAAAISVLDSDFVNVDSLDSSLTEIPGKEENPFQVRTGMQLQEINWIDTIYTDPCIGNQQNGAVFNDAARFPYLSDWTRTRNYYWEQTHDIDWINEKYYRFPTEGRDGVFTPIAAATSRGSTSKELQLPGWFGGHYDGNNYTIKNFYIDVNTDVYQPNCMGLFGAVKDAELKNIVLYSEGGEQSITVRGRSTADGRGTTDAARWWYAGGALVGYAENSAIINCAVAGYTIKDETFRTEDYGRYITYINADYAIYSDYDRTNRVTWETLTNNQTYYFTKDNAVHRFTYPGNDNINDVNWGGNRDGSGWKVGDTNGTLFYKPLTKPEGVHMGGAIGGLVGMVNGTTSLSGCVAVVDIQLKTDHSLIESTSPVRVGGLVGSTTANVENGYSGGTITFDGASNTTVYTGRIIGGVGAGPFGDTLAADSNVTVSNCYSYMDMATATGNNITQTRYNIGGDGSGNAGKAPELTNNFYLGANVSTEAETAAKYVTYLQLAGKQNITIGNQTKSIYQWLNNKEADAAAEEGPYYRVTAVLEGGLSINGRYSYVPASNTRLQGLNYPFPTILTRETADVHVHYGEWNLFGIERYEDEAHEKPKGGSPVELDMFNTRTLTEYLMLSGTVDDIPGGGTWSVESSDPSIVKAELGKTLDTDRTNTLTITAVASSDIPVTVTVTYQVNNNTYSLEITVNVSAGVTLKPGSLSVFPNDTVKVTLTPLELTDGVEYELALQEGSQIGTPDNVNWMWVSEVVTNEDGSLTITLNTRLSTSVDKDEPLWINVPYQYTQGEFTVKDMHRITITMLELPENGMWDTTDEENWTWTIGFGGYDIVTMDNVTVPTGTWYNAAVVDQDSNTITVTTDAGTVPADAALTLIVENMAVEEMIDGITLEHTVTIPVPTPVTQEDLTLEVGQNDSSWLISFEPQYTLETVMWDDANVTPQDGGSTVTLNVPADTTEVTLTVTLTGGSGLRQKLNVTVDLVPPGAPDENQQPIEPNEDGSWTVEIDGWEFVSADVMEPSEYFKAEQIGGSCVITLRDEAAFPYDPAAQADEDDTADTAGTAAVTLNATLSRQSDGGPKQIWELTFTVKLLESKTAEADPDPSESIDPESGENSGAGPDADGLTGETDEMAIAMLPPEAWDPEDPALNGDDRDEDNPNEDDQDEDDQDEDDQSEDDQSGDD